MLDIEQAEVPNCSECEQEAPLRLCQGCKLEYCSRCVVTVEDKLGIKQPYCRECRPSDYSRLPWKARRALLAESIAQLLEGLPYEIVTDSRYETWRWESGEFRLEIPEPSANFMKGEGSL